MKNNQESLDTPETKASHESQSDRHNNATEAPVPDSGSVSISSNDNRKVSREDIELVQNLIERCLQLYMNRDEVVKTLLNRARIDPGFTTLGVTTELDLYLQEKVWIKETEIDLLAWWKTNGVKYPRLQKIARDILAIPISTVASESAFSTSGRLVSPHRSRLHPKTLEALMCAQSWLLNEIKVWQKLEEENADFFRAYYIRLKLKKQIILFNHLLEHQYHLTKYPMAPKLPVAPIHNGIHPMPVNNMPMGYPVLPQPQMAAAGQPHMDSMGMSSCHVVNGVPAHSNFQPMHMNSGNDMVMDNNAPGVTPVPANDAISPMSDLPMSPTSVASSGHFPFNASELSGMGVDTSALDTAFTSDVATSVGLQLLPDNGNSRSLGQIPWNFSLSDLTADLSNLGDLGALGNYPGSPFLPSDSDILLDSPEQDDIVDEFFVDSIPGPPCSQSDEDKS